MNKQKSIKIKKRYLLLIGFLVAIIWSIYKLILLSPFSYMKEVEIENNTINVTIEKRFNRGCYDIGFFAHDNRFNSPAYLPYSVEGKYEFEFYHEDTLLSKKVIEPDTKLGHTHSKGGLAGASSSIILYVVETPLKNHSKLTIKLKSTELEHRLKDKESVYLYIHKHKGLCGEKRTAWMNKRNNPIEKAESNETLKPLYKALVTKNTSKVQELMENNLSIDIEMVGKRNPVHYSAFYNDTETLYYLISNNAKLNEKDLTGKTPLHYAIEHNSTKALEILLDGGVDFGLVDTVDDKYFPPARVPKNRIRKPVENKLVVFLIERNMVELMEVLLGKGYLNIDSDLYRYCLNGMRCETTHLDFLLDRQKYYNDPNRKNKAFNYLEMIRLLRSYGAKTYNELQEENNNTKRDKNDK